MDKGKNIALNPNRTGYPHPLESDNGWGGGRDKWEIIDGKTDYPEWQHGLAFTGGTKNWAGERCGVRQATINFGEPKTFNKVVIWHHGTEHIPKECKLQYWDGSKWVDIESKREVNLDYKSGGAGAFPDVHTLAQVTASKVRYVLDNCKENVLGKQVTHGWIYEFEVFRTEVPIQVRETSKIDIYIDERLLDYHPSSDTDAFERAINELLRGANEARIIETINLKKIKKA